MREVSPFFIQSMIQSRSLKSFFALREENSSEGFMNVLVFLGQPIVAVGLGLIVAILTLGRSLDKHEALTEMEKRNGFSRNHHAGNRRRRSSQTDQAVFCMPENVRERTFYVIL